MRLRCPQERRQPIGRRQQLLSSFAISTFFISGTHVLTWHQVVRATTDPHNCRTFRRPAVEPRSAEHAVSPVSIKAGPSQCAFPIPTLEIDPIPQCTAASESVGWAIDDASKAVDCLLAGPTDNRAPRLLTISTFWISSIKIAFPRACAPSPPFRALIWPITARPRRALERQHLPL